MTLALYSGIENRLIARPYLYFRRLRSRLQGAASKLNRKLPNRDSNDKGHNSHDGVPNPLKRIFKLFIN